MERCVIEFHGFNGRKGEDYVIKELAIICENKRYTLLHFRSKCDKASLEKQYRSTVTWLENNYHFIQWEYGNLTYSEQLMRDLCSHFKTIYTKGLDKKRILSRFHNNVIELPAILPKPRHYDERLPCPAHTKKTIHCALQSAVYYMELIKSCTEYSRELDRMISFLDSSIPITTYTEYAKNGFYYDIVKDRIICVWCEKELAHHVVCVKYYVHNIPLEYSLFINNDENN